jgi:hypothetical protein
MTMQNFSEGVVAISVAFSFLSQLVHKIATTIVNSGKFFIACPNYISLKIEKK